MYRADTFISVLLFVVLSKPQNCLQKALALISLVSHLCPSSQQEKAFADRAQEILSLFSFGIGMIYFRSFNWMVVVNTLKSPCQRSSSKQRWWL